MEQQDDEVPKPQKCMNLINRIKVLNVKPTQKKHTPPVPYQKLITSGMFRNSHFGREGKGQENCIILVIPPNENQEPFLRKELIVNQDIKSNQDYLYSQIVQQRYNPEAFSQYLSTLKPCSNVLFVFFVIIFLYL